MFIYLFVCYLLVYLFVYSQRVGSSSPGSAGASSDKPAASPVVLDGIEFVGSAKEMRERLSRKKKQDPRTSSMNMRDKYTLYQNL